MIAFRLSPVMTNPGIELLDCSIDFPENEVPGVVGRLVHDVFSVDVYICRNLQSVVYLNILKLYALLLKIFMIVLLFNKTLFLILIHGRYISGNHL